ncbi:SGNH/GDSL hydrolase family protein [Saccharibacillus sp. CPCC 101409]|uniref:SGNH/GDSL hydrolase family protein n=1 Tax=Saccharibacillus sp. CPCC 101409 TaxID=3058041 RepID=UPI0026738093|nr:SGNH/GDSL hydrolase family protein [Saccharibacillus sp. CPCC 101409]MDO3411797.1 SGNH/GDSL hydrolase family protein [Saccharibacillus sp. CPCC 101409]
MEFRFAEHARLMGRFDRTEAEAPRCAWVNSAVFLGFSGGEIRMTAEGSDGLDYVEIVLDGVARNWINIKQGTHEYVIEQGLSGGEHTLEIHKRTGILTGGIVFRGFALPQGGRFLAPPPAKVLRLEYFGDSITDGAGIGHPHEVREAPELDDGYMSYAGISARMLNAEYHTLAICGIGVLQDAMGGRNGLPAHFAGTLGAGTTPWDFAGYVPDGIVVNLGQNDYSTPIDDGEYTDAYIGFIDDILRRYGDPYIFCCVGTMSNNYLPGVEQAVRHFNSGGNAKVFVVDLGLIHPEVEGWGGGYHPGYQTHYRMGAELAAFISGKTGWPTLNRPRIATECVF